LLKQLTASGGADLAQLQQQLADLQTRFTDRYPDVIRVKAEIAALTQQSKNSAENDSAANSLQKQLDQVQAEIKSLGQQERQLHNQISVYQSHVENVPRLTQQLQALTQGYEETKEIYSSLLKRYEEASIAQSGPYQGGGNQFHILDAAVVPKDPVGPNRLRLVLLGTLLSLAMAAVAAFLAEQLDTSFHTVEELQAFTKVPVLARIPRIDTVGDNLRRRLRFGVLTLSTAMILLMFVAIAAVIGRDNQVLVWMLTKHSS
jgi:polysaccharide chain length determinant protein (PEP-CTERM system associated)